jgi:hypothetical protein
VSKREEKSLRRGVTAFRVVPSLVDPAAMSVERALAPCVGSTEAHQNDGAEPKEGALHCKIPAPTSYHLTWHQSETQNLFACDLAATVSA